MESITITPSTQPMVSTSSMPSPSETTTVKAKTVQKIDNDIAGEEKQTIKPEDVTKEFNDMSDALNLDVRFAYNEKIDEIYISVTDKNTGRVIQKLPTEEAMKIKESMKDLVGVLFDKKG